MKKLILKISGEDKSQKISLGNHISEYLAEKGYDMAVTDTSKDLEIAANEHDVLVIIE